MFKFASKWAYVAPSTEEAAKEIQVEYDEDDLSSDLTAVSEEALSSVTTAAPDAPDAAAPRPAGGERARKATPLFEALKQKRQAKPHASRVTTKTIRNVDTNVVSVKLGFLSEGVTMATGDPLFCECGAAFSSLDKLANSLAELSPDAAATTSSTTDADGAVDPDLKYWRCAFCNKINSAILSEGELPSNAIVDYIQEVPSQGTSTDERSSVVFCIDISSSMCVTTEVPGKLALKGNNKSNCAAFVDDNSDQYFPGQRRDVSYISRLQSVQAAVSAQIESLAKQQPNSSVGLVTFNDEVTIIGDGKQSTRTVAGDRLESYDELLSIGESYGLEHTIGDVSDTLAQRVFSLEEGGATALGPALLVSVGIASRTPGSKVVICTDGMANVGVGSLDVTDEAQKEAAEKFFETVGLYAKSKGVSIYVISIRGAEASLEQLGVLADITSGTVEMVNPLEITTQFSSIMAIPLVATHVGIKLIISPWMQAHDEDQLIDGSVITKEIGNVTSETETLFEYGMKTGAELPADLSSLPIQVQVHYTKLNGTKCVRVISEAQPITRSRDQAEADADVSVLGLNVMKNAAVVAQRGDYSSARLYSANARHVLERAAASPAQRAQYHAYATNHSRFESAIGQLQHSEQAAGLYYDSAAPAAKSAGSRKSRRTDATASYLWQVKAMNSRHMQTEDVVDNINDNDDEAQ